MLLRARARALALGIASVVVLVAPPAVTVAAAHPLAGDSAPAVDTLPPAAAAERWAWPLEPPVRMIAPFRAPPTPYSAGHRGIDLAAPPGTQVRAAADGVVAFAGPVAGRGVLSIDHGDGVVSAIEPVEASVAVGDRVASGQPVGVTSVGGHCGEVCAHFGVRVHGEYVSPLWFLGGLPRAVLLPLRG